mmetsp:Transcript_25679/g.43001  ORF Transcript_25679/g.43001 Transcript_25679/m.43001 type:complete len:271 (-) Transcript_25679:203-1015(-)
MRGSQAPVFIIFCVTAKSTAITFTRAAAAQAPIPCGTAPPSVASMGVGASDGPWNRSARTLDRLSSLAILCRTGLPSYVRVACMPDRLPPYQSRARLCKRAAAHILVTMSTRSAPIISNTSFRACPILPRNLPRTRAMLSGESKHSIHSASSAFVHMVAWRMSGRRLSITPRPPNSRRATSLPRQTSSRASRASSFTSSETWGGCPLMTVIKIGWKPAFANSVLASTVGSSGRSLIKRSSPFFKYGKISFKNRGCHISFLASNVTTDSAM